MQIIASNMWAWIIVSTQSAISSREGSEYFIPWCPIAMPSSTPMVLKRNGTPPAARTHSLTKLPTAWRWTCPGMMSTWLLQMAMNGLSQSPSLTPVARSRLRWAARASPRLIVSERMRWTSIRVGFVGAIEIHRSRPGKPAPRRCGRAGPACDSLPDEMADQQAGDEGHGKAIRTSSDQARTVAGWRTTSLTGRISRPGGRIVGGSIVIAGRACRWPAPRAAPRPARSARRRLLGGAADSDAGRAAGGRPGEPPDSGAGSGRDSGRGACEVRRARSW